MRQGGPSRFGQPREDPRGAADAPDEVMTAPAQDMQRFDAVMTEHALDRQFERFLQGKGTSRVEVGIGREVEIDILDIEMGDERIAVGQGPADIASGIELRGQLPWQERSACGQRGCVCRDVFGSEVSRLVGSEEFQHPLPHGGLAVVIAEGFENILHVEKMRRRRTGNDSNKTQIRRPGNGVIAPTEAGAQVQSSGLPSAAWQWQRIGLICFLTQLS